MLMIHDSNDVAALRIIGGHCSTGVNSIGCETNGGNNGGSTSSKPLAICVRNLPVRSTDSSLKDGLFHEYKKHGKVTMVKVVGQGTERFAVVCFKKPEDVDKALEVSRDKLFFGCKIEVTAHEGLDGEDNDFRPLEAELDEYHPKATRTLFVGNLEKDVTTGRLRSHFDQFGEIIEIDIKKQGTSTYAFIQYADICSVVKAMRKLDGETLTGCGARVKLGFGKSMPTNCVWLHGISELLSEKTLGRQCARFGPVVDLAVDRERCNCLVFYDSIDCAQIAVTDLKGRLLNGRRLQVDFASRECQNSFLEKLDSTPTDLNKSNSAWESSSNTSVRSRLGPIGSSNQSSTWNADDVEMRSSTGSSYVDHRADRSIACAGNGPGTSVIGNNNGSCNNPNSAAGNNGTSAMNSGSIGGARGAGSSSIGLSSVAMLASGVNTNRRTSNLQCTSGSPNTVSSSLVAPNNSSGSWSTARTGSSGPGTANVGFGSGSRSNSANNSGSRSRYEDDFGAEPIESDGYDEFGPPAHHHSQHHHTTNSHHHLNSSSAAANIGRDHHHRRIEYRESDNRARSFSPCDKEISARLDDKAYSVKNDDYVSKERYV